jgi:hypothetical protein
MVTRYVKVGRFQFQPRQHVTADNDDDDDNNDDHYYGRGSMTIDAVAARR